MSKLIRLVKDITIKAGLTPSKTITLETGVIVNQLSMLRLPIPLLSNGIGNRSIDS